MDVTLRSERLLLRSLGETDAPALLAGLNDFEVVRYLTPVPYPYGAADAKAWLGTLKSPRPNDADFAIELAGEGMVGVISLQRMLGFWLARPYHGRGLVTEACMALLDWRFASLPDELVASSAHEDNVASLRLQRKLGFVEWPGREMRFVRSQGRDVAHVPTTLSRTDYEAAKSRLRRPSWT